MKRFYINETLATRLPTQTAVQKSSVSLINTSLIYLFINFKRFCLTRKNKLKNYLKLGILLFGVSLFIISCQKDDDFKTQEVSNTNKVNIKRVYESEFISNKKLAKKLSEIEYRSNQLKSSKMVYDSIHDFTVNTDEANYIETNGSHSYSFPIYR